MGGQNELERGGGGRNGISKAGKGGAEGKPQAVGTGAAQSSGKLPKLGQGTGNGGGGRGGGAKKGALDAEKANLLKSRRPQV